MPEVLSHFLVYILCSIEDMSRRPCNALNRRHQRQGHRFNYVMLRLCTFTVVADI